MVHKSGEIITDPQFGLVWGYQDGLARAAVYGGIAMVNKRGEVVIPPKYLDLRDFSEGLAQVQVYR